MGRGCSGKSAIAKCHTRAGGVLVDALGGSGHLVLRALRHAILWISCFLEPRRITPPGPQSPDSLNPEPLHLSKGPSRFGGQGITEFFFPHSNLRSFKLFSTRSS